MAVRPVAQQRRHQTAFDLFLDPELPAEQTAVGDEPAEKPRSGAFEERGGVGTQFFSGYLTGEEYNRDLQGLNGIRVYDQMYRSDGDVKAMLRACTLPLLETDWTISPVDDSPEQTEVAQFVQDNLMTGMVYTWRHFLFHALLMYRYGFSVMEIVWALPSEDDGKIRIKKLAPRLAKTIYRWWPGIDDELDHIEQRVWKFDKDGVGRYEMIDIEAWRLLVFSLDQEGNNFEGVSLLRAAYKHWYMKEMLYKIDGIANERHGVGVPVFREPQGAQKTERDRAARILAGLHANERGYILEPFGWEFRFEGMGSAGVKDVMPSIDHHSTMMLRSILAQFLTSTEVGSYARSRVDSSLFLQALQSVGKYICEVVDRLIRMLVDYNYTVKRYPTLKMGELDKSRVEEYLKDIPTLVEKGILTMNPELETAVRKSIGLPDYTPTPEEIADRQVAGLPGEGVDTDSGGEEAEPDEGGEEFEGLAQPANFDRLPSFLEGAVNFGQLAADFDWGLSELSNRTQTVLRQQAESAVDAAIKVQSRGGMVDPGKINIPSTAKLQESILYVMTGVAERGRTQVREEADRQGARARSREMIFGIDSPDDLLSSLEVRSKIIASALTTRLRGTLSLWFSSVFPRRQSREELVEELFQKLNHELADQSGVVVNDSLNLGRVLEAQMIGAPKAQYSALLDKNTCTPCFQLDGEEFETDSAEYLKYMPPYSECKGRRRCRCIYVWDFLGDQGDE